MPCWEEKWEVITRIAHPLVCFDNHLGLTFFVLLAEQDSLVSRTTMHRASSSTCAKYTLPVPHLHGSYSAPRDYVKANVWGHESQQSGCKVLSASNYRPTRGKWFPWVATIFPQVQVSLCLEQLPGTQQLGNPSDKYPLRWRCLNRGKRRHNPQVCGCALP